MLLIVGLGNPGESYRDNRHNIGFMAADRIGASFNFGPVKSKFRGLVREGTIGGKAASEKIVLLQPQTFMNNSGNSVQEAVAFYKLTLDDVFVIYDELDLAPGKVRVKKDGGNAGHNGLRSISTMVGNEYWRIRLGIGHPGDKVRVQSHVLGNFSASEREWLSPLLDAVAQAMPHIVDRDEAGFMNKIALLTAPPKVEPTSTGNPSSKAAPKEK